MTQQAPGLELDRRLRALPPDALEIMYDAAAQALDALGAMASRGLNPVTAALEGAERVEEWAHFPDGDARGSHARYYYHAHAAEELGEDEHGHFHIFLEPPPDEPDTAPTHIVGLAMDASGRLLRLFTTNGWVTGETWRAAEHAIAALADFEIISDAERQDLDRWISSVVRLFAPQIEDLLRRRDGVLGAMRARDADALEDRSVRILSEEAVDLPAQIAAIERALDA